MKAVTVGVIGYGHFMRTNFVPQFADCPEIDVIAVYNRGEERRQHAVDDGYWATGDLDELLAVPGLESVIIGSSNSAHKEQAIKAAQAGKHIICEKPLALTVKDMDAMLDAVESTGVVNHVNHGGPYAASFVKFKELCEQEVGDILHYWKRSSRAFGTWIQGARHVAVANPEESGGWTFHHFCHQLNELCIIMNEPVVKVYHVCQKSCPEAPSEEIVNSMIHFKSGATALLTDGTSIGSFNDLGVQGTKADLRVINGEIILEKPGPGDPLGRPGNRRLGPCRRIPIEGGGKNLSTVGGLFAQAVRGGENKMLSFRFMRDQYKIMEAMKKSAALGEAVELEWDS